MNITFSIVMPLYNKEKYIKKTLTSVINQIYTNFELIIVNDGCTDNSVEIAKDFKDSRIKIIHQENNGLSSARNSGIKAASYDYIAFLDADDLWCEDYLLTIYNLIKFNNSCKIFATTVKTVTLNQKVDLTRIPFKTSNIKFVPNYFNLKKNVFGFSSIVIKKEVFDKIGDFDTTVNYGEEEDFFIRCFDYYTATYYKKHKVNYLRGVEDQLTSPKPNTYRIVPNYSKYLNSKNRNNLKPYIDFIYYKLVLLYKMEKNNELVTFYKNKIDTSNLSIIKKIKYYLPTPVFYFFKRMYLSTIRYFF